MSLSVAGYERCKFWVHAAKYHVTDTHLLFGHLPLKTIKDAV